ncbi:MAG: VWA domain-containing protein [Bifidobacteriaceae bacterium]|jgi:hypothetical protein|nr:VWA domain-containing protein [Bifidobacteriaceae bacterium]
MPNRPTRLCAALFLSAILPATLAAGLTLGVPAASGTGDSGTAEPTITKVVDPATIGTMPPATLSTQNVGRIWTDKTVSTGPIELTSGNAAVQNTGDFLVALSALSSSSRVTGVAETPLDVVFVLDLSGSMSDSISAGDPAPKYQTLVRLLNQAIGDLMKANPLNRVAVVGFSGALWHQPGTFQDTTLFMDLGHYPQADTYFTYTTGDIPVVTANSVSREVTGGTNIQAGLYKGMELLTASNPTYTDSNGSGYRVPSVVLVSDGAPTFTRNSDTWWNLPEPGLNTDLQGNGQDIYPGNSFLALLTASFMKKKVEENYNPGYVPSNEPTKTKIYTVGVGLGDNSSDPNDANLAAYTLDPKGQAGVGNAMSNAVEGYWTAYSGGGTPAICVDGAAVGSPCDSAKDYTVQHPTGTDVPYDPTSLAYNDLFTPVESADQLCEAFRSITDHIVENTMTVPTRVWDVDGNASGYITFTDQLGDYMAVKDLVAVAYGDTVFSAKTTTTSGDTTTYAFQGTVNANTIYRYGDVSHIIIQVTRGAVADTVKVQIPAALIPLREYAVLLDASGQMAAPLTVTDAYPVSVFYTVSLRDGVAAAVAAPGGPADAALKAYASANRDASGQVAFYTNAYDRATAGGAGTKVPEESKGLTTATFEPNPDDAHYYFLKPAQLYADAACSVAAVPPFNAAGPYWFKHSYYESVGATQDACVELATGASELAAYAGTDQNVQGVSEHDGGLWINRHTKHVTQVSFFDRAKDVNATGTAACAIVPAAWDGTDLYTATTMTVHLGNNGRLLVAPLTEPSSPAPSTPSSPAPSGSGTPPASSAPPSGGASTPAESSAPPTEPTSPGGSSGTPVATQAGNSLPVTGVNLAVPMWCVVISLFVGALALSMGARYRARHRA